MVPTHARVWGSNRLVCQAKWRSRTRFLHVRHVTRLHVTGSYGSRPACLFKKVRHAHARVTLWGAAQLNSQSSESFTERRTVAAGRHRKSLSDNAVSRGLM